MDNGTRVCVIGAGVMGLCAGVQVQEMMMRRGVSKEVVLMAEKFEEETTSDGAAGMFNPTVAEIEDPPRNISRQWFRDSFKFFNDMAMTEEAPEAGISFVSGYEFFKETEIDEDPIYKELYYDLRECNEKEYKMFGLNGIATKGIRYTTLMIEGRWFLPWMMRRFIKNGGKCVQRKVKSLRELADNFDIVINCSGLGSNELLGNNETIPIRGQLIRAKATWIKHFFSIDGKNCYIIPGKETLILGGTYQKGDKRKEVSNEDADKIWNTACKYIPSIKKAEVQWDWVGFRPHRKPLRLEKETMMFDERKLEVVHNYGHGGNGIALCWGTGKVVCDFVEQILFGKKNDDLKSRSSIVIN